MIESRVSETLKGFNSDFRAARKFRAPESVTVMLVT